MAVKTKYVSLDELIKRCLAQYAVYSPSRGKVFDFAIHREHKDISTSQLMSVNNFGTHVCFLDRYEAELQKGIAVSDGWTDAVVKMVYTCPPFLESVGGNVVSGPALLENTTMIPDVQGFADWLISHNYAQIVTMVGDL